MNTMKLFWLFILAPLAMLFGPFIPMAVLVFFAMLGIGSVLWRHSDY